MRARKCGLSRETFWDSTIRELARELAIARELELERHNDRMRYAWTIAALSRARKFPPLRELLIGEPRRQSRRELSGALAVLSAQYGIPIVRRHYGR
jgi:hypothetical protein